MKRRYKVYVIGSDFEYLKLFEDAKAAYDMETADIVLFTGGADVDPKLYGETPHKTVYSNPSRDDIEILSFQKAKKLGKFMLGICRGAQFLTVMNGGKLVQHVNGHAIQGVHAVHVNNNITCMITSTHHQMMYPYFLDRSEYELIAWSAINRSNDHWKNNNKRYDFSNLKEPEIVWYNKTSSLCIQGHPERQVTNKLTFNTINRIINDKFEMHYAKKLCANFG